MDESLWFHSYLELRSWFAGHCCAPCRMRKTRNVIMNIADRDDRYGYHAEKRDALERWSRRLRIILSGLDHVTSSEDTVAGKT